ncbi:MAG: hypothetical protein WBQ27_17465, partial [Thermoanaerobaculia bacterium]
MTLSFLLRLKRSPWAALACIAAMLLPLVACTIRKPIAAHSTNSNLAAEIANNRMLLLNIVRAMKYEPKYFTAVTMSRGQASASMTPSLAIPFGVGWLRDINPAAGLSVTATGGLSNVDVVVLDSHEFVRGLMQPVSTRTLAYFWRQGWDPEILFQLFFREIVSEPDANRGMTKKFESHAKDGFTDFQEFNGAIRNYLDKGLTACQVEKQVGPDFKMDSNLDTWISAASKAHDAGLHLTSDPNNENIQLMKNEMEFEFFWGDPNDRWRICLPENAAIRDNFRVENQGLWIRRSTEGIIYFLG